MRQVLTIASIHFLCWSGSVSAQPVMAGEELSQIAERVRKHVPKDAFDTPAAPASVSGKRFSYMARPLQRGLDNEICDGSPTWGYFAENQQFEVAANPGQARALDILKQGRSIFPSALIRSQRDPSLRFYSFTCQHERPPSYVGQNAYGASYEISRESKVVTAIAEFGSTIEKDWKPYWITKTSGEEGRALSQNLQFRVSGTLEDWWPGTAMLCGRKTITPTVRFRYEDTLDICMFKGRPDLIELIDARTGTVIYKIQR